MNELRFRPKGSVKEQESAQGWSFQPFPGGVWVATHTDGRRVRLYAARTAKSLHVQLAGRAHAAELKAVDRARAAQGADAADLASELTAQFPGKVRKVMAQLGTTYPAGETLLVVEAMKMEFAIKCSAAVRVKRVLVQEGAQLSPGDLYLEVEPA